MSTIAAEEQSQIDEANASRKTPVVFIHGLWLLPSSWDRWAGVFADAGFAPLTPGWPDDPQTVEEAKAHPEVFANKSIGDVADHYASVIDALDKKPAVIGHSFGDCWRRWWRGEGSRPPPWPSTPRRSGACFPYRSRPCDRPSRSWRTRATNIEPFR